MFGWSFVEVPWIYCISSPGDTLLGLSGKGRWCPTAFLCCHQHTRRLSIASLLQTRATGREVDEQESELHINGLELLAALSGAEAGSGGSRGHHSGVFLDNATFVWKNARHVSRNSSTTDASKATTSTAPVWLHGDASAEPKTAGMPLIRERFQLAGFSTEA